MAGASGTAVPPVAPPVVGNCTAALLVGVVELAATEPALGGDSRRDGGGTHSEARKRSRSGAAAGGEPRIEPWTYRLLTSQWARLRCRVPLSSCDCHNLIQKYLRPATSSRTVRSGKGTLSALR